MSRVSPRAALRGRRRVVSAMAVILLAAVAPVAGATTTPTPVPTPGAPQTFSSVADVTWGTPGDASRTDPNHPAIKYAQLVTAVAEAGNRLYVAGSFTNL